MKVQTKMGMLATDAFAVIRQQLVLGIRETSEQGDEALMFVAMGLHI